jgi:hypothetical protein
MDLTVLHNAKSAKEIYIWCCRYSAYATSRGLALEENELELTAESLTTASVLMPESEKKQLKPTVPVCLTPHNRNRNTMYESH